MFKAVTGVLFHLLLFSDGLQLNFGDCPVFLYERCTHSESVKFILSIQSHNQTAFYYLDPFSPDLPAEFNNYVPLKIVIHGYGGLDLDPSTTSIIEAYENIGYNVITVDWKPLAEIPCYATAYLNTWHVAQCLSILVVSLMPLGINPKSIHVVGFSLGAHISGLAGNNLQKVLGTSFSRITGLDPALPFFATLSNDWKLDKSDADFVDVIHTSAGTFGKVEATGHADFYVNGGVLQPACISRRYPPLCSHIMAGLYFAESIKSSVEGGNSFIAKPCENIVQYFLGLCGNSEKLAVMGENTYYLTRGSYFLETNDKAPYALGFKSYYYKNKLISKKSAVDRNYLRDVVNSIC
ncbi:phospholipase A1-like [Sitophilus oryzae]|uniref:Phospholipase A1-like n=1 Tax=Sitophilus oryzae TaxID=7048 RepID=A0A6J2XXD2_SITOR|nr:phospholipase A1-like [Sitophilus oryzae]